MKIASHYLTNNLLIAKQSICEKATKLTALKLTDTFHLLLKVKNYTQICLKLPRVTILLIYKYVFCGFSHVCQQITGDLAHVFN